MADDPSKSLELKIVTKADLAGAKAAEATLEATVTKAKYLGKAYADQEAQLARLRNAIKDCETANGEATESEKPFEHEMGEVKKSVRELNEQFPLAAAALRILTNPVGGALAIGIAMFGWFKEKLDEWNKTMDETSEILRKPDFEDAIKGRKEVLEAAEVAAAQYADKLAHLIDPEEHYQKIIQTQISLLQARNAAMNTVADATSGLDEAKLKQNYEMMQEALKQQLQAGVISEAKYTAEKLRLDSKYYDDLTQLEIAHEQEKLARDKALRDAIQKANADALAHAKTEQPKLEAAAQAARDKAVGAAAAVARDQENLDEALSKKDDRQKAVDAAEAYIHDHYRSLGDPTGMKTATEGAAGGDPLAAKALADYQRAVEMRNDGLNEIAQLNKRLPGEKVDAAGTLAGSERADAAAEANAQRIQEQQDALAAEKAKNKIADDADSKANATKSDTQRLKERGDLDKLNIGNGYTGADFENIAALERIKAMGGQLTDKQRQQIDAFKEFAQSVGANMHELTQTMFITAGAMTTQSQQIAALKKAFELLTKRQADIVNK